MPEKSVAQLCFRAVWRRATYDTELRRVLCPLEESTLLLLFILLLFINFGTFGAAFLAVVADLLCKRAS